MFNKFVNLMKVSNKIIIYQAQNLNFNKYINYVKLLRLAKHFLNLLDTYYTHDTTLKVHMPNF